MCVADLELALKESFIEADRLFNEKAKREFLNDGTTAVVALRREGEVVL